MFPFRFHGVFLALTLMLSPALPAFAQQVGSVTSLPLPRFVSMKAAEGNVCLLYTSDAADE